MFALTTAVVWLPLVALFLRHGVAVGLAGVAALYGAAVGATTAIAIALLVGQAAGFVVARPRLPHRPEDL